MGGAESPPNLQHPKPPTNKSPETSGSKHPESQFKQHTSGPAPSRNSNHGLERANLTSKIEVADQRVFDVPSSDEDIPKLKPTIRRALTSSQKRLGSGRLEENRIPPIGRGGGALGDREEAKTSRPIVTLGQAVTKIQSTAMREPVNVKDGGKQPIHSRTVSKTSITEKADVNAAASQKPIQSRILSAPSTRQQLEGMKDGANLASVRAKERQKPQVNPRNERQKLEDNPKMEGEPPSEWRLDTLKKSKDGGISRGERKPEVVIEIPSAAGVPPVQRRPRKQRPRKQRGPNTLPGKPEQQPLQAPVRPSLPKLKKTVTRESQNKVPVRLPSKSPTGVESLYISSPVLEIQEPTEVHRGPSATHSPSGGSSLWDEIMGGTESEDQPTARKPKRSRESGNSDGEVEKGPTLPRRRRLIDTLEVDWTVRRPKQRILEVEMDVDSDSGSADDTLVVALTDSQAPTDLQCTDGVEDAAQAFQRGVGAIQGAPAFPQRNTRVTYARQRSFLTEEVKEGGDPFADPLLLPVRDFGRGLRKETVVEEDVEDHGPGMMKSLHELREAGVNKRFLDSVEGYFEDIERGFSIGQKRVGYSLFF